MANRSGHRIAKLHDRLAQAESVVMDGGMGTGLQAMGVPMDGEAWSGVANLTHANAVRELHAAYLVAGAEILIANTFATGPGPLSAAGYGTRFEEANRNAVAAAVQARADAGRDEVVVAGSMSRDVANGLADTGIPHAVSADGRALRDAYRRQAEVLVDAGVDVIALEMMGARTHAQPAVAAAAELNIPVWLGISVAAAARDGAATIDGEDVSELMSELPMDAIDAVFVMHSNIGLVTDSLHVIRAIWDGTVGAYPHVGEWTPPNWVFQEIAPARFADHAGEWVSNGATIVGGCCGIGPEHIRELTNALT